LNYCHYPEGKFWMDGYMWSGLEAVEDNYMRGEDNDWVAIVTGMEDNQAVRVGKSTLACQMAKKLDPSFPYDCSRVCFDSTEFMQQLQGATRRQAIVFDEAYKDLGTDFALTHKLKRLKSIFMEMGQKNLYLIIVMPSFRSVPEWLAKDRSNVLFTCYINRTTGRKGYWGLYDKHSKSEYWDYIRRLTKGRKRPYYLRNGMFANTLPIDPVKYAEKKQIALTELLKSSIAKDKNKTNNDLLAEFIRTIQDSNQK